MMQGFKTMAAMRTPRRGACQGSRGFTLIEILVTLLVFSIVSTAIFGVFVTSNRAYLTQAEVVAAQQGVRVGMDFIARELRMAGFDPTQNAGAGFQVATLTRVRFSADNDMDGTIESANEELITYEYDAANDELVRILYETDIPNKVEQNLVDHVSGLTFAYFDSAGNTLPLPVSAANLGNISTVDVTLTCWATDPLDRTITRTLRTRVRCRNL